MEKHTREVIAIKKIVFTVFMLTSLSMTIPSHVSLQLKAAGTFSDSDCGEITIRMDGVIVSDSPDCQAKFDITDKIYRLKENISFERSN